MMNAGRDYRACATVVNAGLSRVTYQRPKRPTLTAEKILGVARIFV